MALSLGPGLISVALAACRASGDGGAASQPASVLLFSGRGTSSDDVEALEKVLIRERLSYNRVNTPQLNGMTGSQLREYRALVVPGGNFEQIGNSLTPNAAANIRNAVQNGLNYLGVCAGAFFAGNSPYNGLNLTSGSRFGFYANEALGIRKAAVAITTAGGETLDQYWEDGPELSSWGLVVARYPNGTSAVVEGTFGKGFVILTGVHPEAPASWRRGMKFNTPVGDDHAFAAVLLQAALTGKMLPHY